MIIEAPYKVNDTVTIKTTNGDEIVARFVEENANTITIQKPMALMATPQGIGLGPFTFTAPTNAKVPLNKNAVLFVLKTDADMAKQYISSTSGIQMV